MEDRLIGALYFLLGSGLLLFREAFVRLVQQRRGSSEGATYGRVMVTVVALAFMVTGGLAAIGLLRYG
jgi:hypothetical protein